MVTQLLASKVLGITSKERMCCIGFVVGLGCFWTLLFSRKKGIGTDFHEKVSVAKNRRICDSILFGWDCMGDRRGDEASYTFFSKYVFPSIPLNSSDVSIVCK